MGSPRPRELIGGAREDGRDRGHPGCCHEGQPIAGGSEPFDLHRFARRDWIYSSVRGTVAADPSSGARRGGRCGRFGSPHP